MLMIVMLAARLASADLSSAKFTAGVDNSVRGSGITAEAHFVLCLRMVQLQVQSAL